MPFGSIARLSSHAVAILRQLKTTIDGVLTDIPGYRVTLDGRVCSCWVHLGGCKWVMGDDWFALSTCPNWQGYLLVGIRFNGRSYTRSVHRLILESFVGACLPGMQARHWPDPDKTNNRLGNLSWSTQSRNEADKVSHGTSNRGSGCARARLTEAKVREIWRRLGEGESQTSIAARFGVSSYAVSHIFRGNSWGHITKGLAPLT
jgi:hypothetical protein